MARRTTSESSVETDAGPVATFKAGYVAIVGRANVGKSTLLNQLLGHKLSIVSPRPHTTRYRILGVLQGPRSQVAFLDTPGYPGHPRDWLDSAMARQWQEALEAADLVVLVAEPRPPGDVERRLMEQLRDLRKPSMLVVNKIDTVAKGKLLPVLDAYAKACDFLELVPISALRRDGVDLLVGLIVQRLPEGEPLFSQDTVTDRSQQFRVGEAIREKVYQLFGAEIPYQVAVTVDALRPGEGGDTVYVGATIHVERESQRRILVGSGGQAVREVGVQARQDIEQLLGRPVYLDLRVTARRHWRNETQFVQEELGYREG